MVNLTQAVRAAPDPGSQKTQETFKASDLVVEPHPNPQSQPVLEDVKFGQVFTDHMFIVDHVQGRGWGTPTIRPYGPIQIYPAAQVLHYGMGCFEGMKAYRDAQGRGRLFRPEANMARLYKSSRRLMLADYDPQELLECLKALLRTDHAWLPAREGYSLYIRPLIFSSTDGIGIAPPTKTTIVLMACPAGPYLKARETATILIDEQHVRAWPGGVGDCKVGGNYAPTFLLQAQAQTEHGAQQVAYTLPAGASPDDAVFSECGAMNLFAFLECPGGGCELVTPPLDGTILAGVTRDSVLAMARGWGEFDVSERPLSIGEVKLAAQQGRLKELFGVGTAVMVQPITALTRANGEQYASTCDYSSPACLKNRIVQELLDIQYGRVPSKWSVTYT